MRNARPSSVRSRGVIALVILLLLAFTATGAVQSTPVWEDAVEISSESTQTFASFRGLDCIADDDCVLAGYLGFNPSVAALAEKVDGVWGELQENVGLSAIADWDSAASTNNGPVSCTADDCFVGGNLGLLGGGSTAYVASRVGGSWSASIIPGLAALSTDQGAPAPLGDLVALSCGPGGNCLAGGSYRYGAANNLFGAWVATRTNGTWSNAIDVPGIPELNVKDNARVNRVSCADAGGCVAIGTYMADVAGAARSQAFIAQVEGGEWSDAFPVGGLAPPEGANLGSASFEGLDCATFGDCAATGRYWNGTAFQGFVVNKTAGSWGDATDIPGFAPAANVALQHVSCPAVGACVLTAENVTTNTGYFASQVEGTWQNAVPLVFSADVGTPVLNAIRGISCSAPGECLAVGIYRASDFSTFQAWQATQDGGAWAEGNSIPGMAELLTNPPTRSHGESVACVAGAGCNLGGVTFFGGAPHRAFAAARVTPPPPPTTTTAPEPTTTTTAPEPTTTTTVAPSEDALDLVVNFGVGDDIRLGGSTVTASGTGLAPFADFIITLRSDPQVIGATVTDSVGDAEVDATIPADTSPGAHSITAESLDAAGELVSSIVWFTIGDDGLVTAISADGPTPGPAADDSGSAGMSLPVTGAAVVGLAVVGIGMLVGGVVLVAGGRRREQTV